VRLTGMKVRLAHHERSVLARRVRNTATGFKMISELFPSACCVELRQTPLREVCELRKAGEFFDLRLAAKVRQWLVTVEPDVFQFIFGHSGWFGQGCEIIPGERVRLFRCFTRGKTRTRNQQLICQRQPEVSFMTRFHANRCAWAQQRMLAKPSLPRSVLRGSCMK
jgi:hypothetical protein